jgi:RNA binding exosome subunit
MILNLVMAGKISDIYIEAFVNATEVESRVREAICNVIGPDVALESTDIEGTFGNPLIILRARISRKKEVDKAMGRIAASDYFARSLERAEDRMDPDGCYHIRLDKSSAYLGQPKLWVGGECIDLRIKVTTYPSSRSEAMVIIHGLGPGQS